MREIKFRAWDTENQTWTFVTLGDLVCGACLSSGGKPLSGARQKWEQYTGLKDENGKEIYEGDIVSMNLEDEELEQGDCKLISFRDGCFRVGNGYEDEAGFHLRDWRIVGNIHENTELLKLLED